jgi:hypothetical protein
MPHRTQPTQGTRQALRERLLLFVELCRRASPQQIRIALYLMRLHLERQQAPSASVDAEIARIQNAIDTGRVEGLTVPSLH